MVRRSAVGRCHRFYRCYPKPRPRIDAKSGLSGVGGFLRLLPELIFALAPEAGVWLSVPGDRERFFSFLDGILQIQAARPGSLTLGLMSCPLSPVVRVWWLHRRHRVWFFSGSVGIRQIQAARPGARGSGLRSESCGPAFGVGNCAVWSVPTSEVGLRSLNG